jgi:hypothetical protein
MFSTREEADLDAPHARLPMQIPSKEGDLTCLHLIAGPVYANGDMRKFGPLMHTDHIVFNAAASKVVINRYLQHLALTLSGLEIQSKVFTGQRNLNPPSAYIIMAESDPRPVPSDCREKPSFTHPYYASLGQVMKAAAEFMTVRCALHSKDRYPN